MCLLLLLLQIAPPTVAPEAPLQLLVTNIDYDEHKGRIAIGRVTSGTVKKAQQVWWLCQEVWQLAATTLWRGSCTG